MQMHLTGKLSMWKAMLDVGVW